MVDIVVGQVFKNYKELCNYLQEPIKDGPAKQYQLKYWATFFTLQKQGHKLKVVKVTQPYRPKLETMRNSENYPVMVNLLAELHKSYTGVKVSNTLPKQYTEIIIYTSELSQLLGFCKKSFFSLKDGDEKIEFTREEQRRVYNVGNAIFRDKIRHTLDTLANHNFIVANKTYIIITNERDTLDLASADEHNLIEVLKAEALGELHKELYTEGRIKSKYGKFTEGDCHNLRVEDRLYAKLEEKLLSRTNIVKSYAVNQILFTEAMYNRMNEFKLTFMEQEALTDTINTSLVNILNNKLEDALQPLVEDRVKR